MQTPRELTRAVCRRAPELPSLQLHEGTHDAHPLTERDTKSIRLSCMNEEWRPVVGFEGLYSVSSAGRVRSDARKINGRWGEMWVGGIMLKPRGDRRGYARVVLHRDGRPHDAPVHRLMLEAFVGPRPDGMVACHADDDPTHNSIANLRWDTPNANARDRVRNGHDANRRKTHCTRGHELIEPNLVPANLKRGSRVCRACHGVRKSPDPEAAAARRYARIMKH